MSKNAEALQSLLVAVQAGDVTAENRALGSLVGGRSEVAREAAKVALQMLELGFAVGARLGDNGDEGRAEDLLRVALEAYLEAYTCPGPRPVLSLV